MGSTWRVQAWVMLDAAAGGVPIAYSYEEVYAGESLLQALRAAWRAKRAGAGCVKVEWR